MTGPGVWITGPSRSGTSMTAGLFAAHGVWFGDCGEGDRHNPGGYYEHPELVRRVEGGDLTGWPDVWWDLMDLEGHEEGQAWGVKRGPNAWPWIRPLYPNLIVVCHRPDSQILTSRKRWGKKGGKRPIKKARERIANILNVADAESVVVKTSALVKGDYSSILPAFDALGVPFSESVAGEWINPAYWNRGKP